MLLVELIVNAVMLFELLFALMLLFERGADVPLR